MGICAEYQLILPQKKKSPKKKKVSRLLSARNCEPHFAIGSHEASVERRGISLENISEEKGVLRYLR